MQNPHLDLSGSLYEELDNEASKLYRVPSGFNSENVKQTIINLEKLVDDTPNPQDIKSIIKSTAIMSLYSELADIEKIHPETLISKLGQYHTLKKDECVASLSLIK